MVYVALDIQCMLWYCGSVVHILPYLIWWWAWDSKGIDKAFHRVIREMKKSLEGPWVCIYHTQQTGNLSDGVHLSEKGNQTFSKDLQQVLLSTLG